MSEPKYTNSLVNETSPYLLQHAHNPVHWYPWGEEALLKARREDKPILLSIGYSACHWCHVMAHESFEDEETARLMNEHFINIKVDREERPDLDTIYMTAVQLTTGSGGWPMTVFLTPDQMPFYCGTYFPPEEKYGMPSFRQVLLAVAKAYREKREVISQDGASIVTEIRRPFISEAVRADPNEEILRRAASGLSANYDPQYGGFGRAPKFPPSMALSYLMRSWLREREKRYLEMVDQTLTNMACGGIYDQIGGGFHRYSVDAQWLVPHFEKMLYDNALLSRAYLEGYLLTKNDLYRRVCFETLDYVIREMRTPEGGFYSSQDADSEGKEGLFFLWTVGEIKSLLGEEDGDLFCSYFNVTPQGNFEGRNILHVTKSVGEVARLNQTDTSSLLAIIERGRQLLFDAREKRVRPGRDEKILTAWNGLMLRSFAEASSSFVREDYRDVAVSNAEFLLGRMFQNGRLFRSHKDGRTGAGGYLEDYAFLVDGLISLYEATFDPRWVRQAEDLSDLMIRGFWDDQEDNGFYFTSGDHETLIHRPKEFLDNAAPAGNSVAAHALLRLAELTGDHRWRKYPEAILKSLSGIMAQHPSAFPNMLCALDFYVGRPREVAVIGRPEEEKTRKLLDRIFGEYLPNKVVACGLDGGISLLEGKPQIDGDPTVYVCENFACSAPVTDPEALAQALHLDALKQD